MSRNFRNKIGSQIGKWTLTSPLGAGGNGEVWKATSREGVEVALKIVYHQDATNVRYKRFVSEVGVMQRVNGVRGVVPYVDAYLPANPNAKSPAWLAMEIATPITEALRDASLETVVEAVAVIAQTLASLCEIHGISHRDIKPNNLYKYSGTWSVGDFGLAEFPDQESLTRTNERLGPANFLAPEMLNAKDAEGAPADVYALAKTLWVLATGQNFPPAGEIRCDREDILLSSSFNHPRAYLIDTLIESATSHSPNNRPNMAKFASELSLWLSTPPKATGVTDIQFLSHRIEALRGDKWRMKGRNVQEQNERIQRDAFDILAEFDSYFFSIHEEFEKVGLAQFLSESSQHGDEIWSCFEIAPEPPTKRLWQRAQSLFMQPNPSRPVKKFTYGVCVMMETTNTESNQVQYCADKPTYIAASYVASSDATAELECLWGEVLEIKFSTPSAELTIHQISSELRANFRQAFEHFIMRVESE